MRLAEIEERVADSYTSETFASPRMKRLIAAAVREYSRWNPYLKSTTITTVADQDLYNLPADCVVSMGLRVEYWPTGGLSTTLTAANEYATLYRHPYTWQLISERVIDDINEAEHVKRVTGHWRVYNNRLELRPVPSSGTIEVDVVYGSVHVLNTDQTAYDTIPDEDLDIVVDLTVREILKGKKNEVVAEPDYQEGLQRETKGHMLRNLRQAMADLQESVRAKYDNSVVRLT